jgi:cysteinyl-tRNA synthetase
MAQTAFDNLDTAAAIALLRGLAGDESVPDGAKFETFLYVDLYVDRVLGLNLPSDIGKAN